MILPALESWHLSLCRLHLHFAVLLAIYSAIAQMYHVLSRVPSIRIHTLDWRVMYPNVSIIQSLHWSTQSSFHLYWDLTLKCQRPWLLVLSIWLIHLPKWRRRLKSTPSVVEEKRWRFTDSWVAILKLMSRTSIWDSSWMMMRRLSVLVRCIDPESGHRERWREGVLKCSASLSLLSRSADYASLIKSWPSLWTPPVRCLTLNDFPRRCSSLIPLVNLVVKSWRRARVNLKSDLLYISTNSILYSYYQSFKVSDSLIFWRIWRVI